MATTPPTSQLANARPIAFLLDDTVSGLGPTQAVTLYIRPEDLTRQDPSRVTIVQTLNGGAWGDSYGPGIAVITIAGTTGWRATEGSTEDGEGRFLALRAQAFDQWHLRRAQARKASKDPNGVQLIFSDSLDNFVATVAPMSFTLRRSRSRPLLMQYQIQMSVLADGVGSLAGPLPPGATSKSVLASLGLESLDSSLAKIQSFAADAQNFIDRSILAPVKGFLSVTQAIYGRVMDTVGSIDAVTSSVVAVANTSAAAGANLFRTLAVVGGLPQFVEGELMRVGAAYANIFCVLNNALKVPDQFLDYSTLYGSSNCSSTAGGSPLSPFEKSNTFAAVSPLPTTAAISVSQDAQASLRALSSSDVALMPMDTPTIGMHALAIANGVHLS